MNSLGNSSTRSFVTIRPGAIDSSIGNSPMELAMAPGRMVTNDLVSAPTISMDVVENDKNYTIHAELPGSFLLMDE